MTDIETMLHQGLAATRCLEATDSDVKAIRGRANSSAHQGLRSSFTGRPAAWLAGAVLAIGVVAVSPAGAAFSDVASNFAGYFGGDETDAPGQSVAESDVPPSYGLSEGDTERRLLAADGDHRLFVARQGEGESIVFAYDGAVWMGGQGSWEDHLSQSPIFILGAPLTKQAEETGERPMYGIVADDVATVEAEYQNGDQVEADASSGGFILVLDPDLNLARVTALDADSKEVGSVPGGAYDLR